MTVCWQTGDEIAEKCRSPFAMISHRERIMNTRFISKSNLRRLLANVDRANPCMKCGSVQCALCSKDLERELFLSEKGDGVK